MEIVIEKCPGKLVSRFSWTEKQPSILLTLLLKNLI